MQSMPSRLLEQAVNELSKMPGIGRRTALRLALWLLKQEPGDVQILGNALIRLRDEVKYCTNCHNLTDHALCEICSDSRRNDTLICVVQDIRDVMAIEQTGQYRGMYHVLGGVISPLEGIGPHELTIQPLIQRLQDKDSMELIMALNSSIEGDTTAYYIYKMIKDLPVKVTTIARGIPVGDELEYADEVTLGRSILQRVPYETDNRR